MGEKIKNCWCWLNGAMVMALLVSIAGNIAIYKGTISRQSPESVCQQVMDIVNNEHQMIEFAKTAQVKRGK